MRDIDAPALLDLATILAMDAGEILQEGRRSGFGAIASKTTPVDIVTEIDKASEAHIVAALRKQRPDDGILGEEGSTVASSTGVRWLIDPLDGTVNFTYGIPNYAVCVGAEVDGVVVAGAVYNPATNELFRAAQGSGAYCNDQPISVRDEVPFAHALVATGFGYAAERRAMQAEVVRRLLPEVRDLRRMGSAALDMCGVAAGRLDAYYEYGVWPWDVGAATVIVREAGGLAVGFDGGEPANNVITASCAAIEKELRGHVVDATMSGH